MADKLFNEPPDVLVAAYDIRGNLHERPLRNFRFRVSVYGLLRRDDKILVNRHPLQSRYGLPGGGVELGESLHSALVREFREETGLEIRPVRLLDATEGFFTFRGEDAHGILLLYEVETIGKNTHPVGNRWDSVDIQFMPIDQLQDGRMVPIFARFLENLMAR